MGEAKVKNSTAPLDVSRDRALVTKGDLTSVQVWCDQVRADVIELQDDRDERSRQWAETFAQETRANVQALRDTVDEYRRDDLQYRNNVSVRGRLRRLKWWLLAVLPFGIGACIGTDGAPVGGSSLRTVVDSARHVACYEWSVRADAVALSCVRIDSLTVWREQDSTWVSR